MDLLILLLVVGAVTFALALWEDDESRTGAGGHNARRPAHRHSIHRRPHHS